MLKILKKVVSKKFNNIKLEKLNPADDSGTVSGDDVPPADDSGTAAGGDVPPADEPKFSKDPNKKFGNLEFWKKIMRLKALRDKAQGLMQLVQVNC